MSLQPQDVNQWFPEDCERAYVNHIAQKCNLTPEQIKRFVRLWAYGQAQKENQSPPIQRLEASIPVFRCSQQDAADLFGGGITARAAGQTINNLAKQGLLTREVFDGGSNRFKLDIKQGFLLRLPHSHGIGLYPDAFDLDVDEVCVANFLTKIYDRLGPEHRAKTSNILNTLRQWAIDYPRGLRVLRKDDGESVGFAAFFPVPAEFETKLYDEPPSASIHLSTSEDHDPLQVASPGDETCYSVFIRSWMIPKDYWNYTNACKFLEDSKQVLKEMQETFPNIRTLVTLSIHPLLDKLAQQVGFKMMSDVHPKDSIRWMYTPLKRFLALDIDEVMADFDFEEISRLQAANSNTSDGHGDLKS